MREPACRRRELSGAAQLSEVRRPKPLASFSGETNPCERGIPPSRRWRASAGHLHRKPAVTLPTLRQHQSDHRREATRQRSGICEALAEDTQVLLRMAKAWLLSPSLHSYIGKTTDRKIHAEKVKTSASPGRKAGSRTGRQGASRACRIAARRKPNSQSARFPLRPSFFPASRTSKDPGCCAGQAGLAPTCHR